MTTITPERIAQIEARFAELAGDDGVWASSTATNLSKFRKNMPRSNRSQRLPLQSRICATNRRGWRKCSPGDDAEMKAMAAEEVDGVKKALAEAEHAYWR